MAAKSKKRKSWFAEAWEAYGGKGALLKSTHFWAAVALTIWCYPLWSKAGWWDHVLAILPSLLGFSLAGMAMLLAFGSEKFHGLLMKKRKNKPTAFIKMASTYSFFIFLQTAGIILATICKACNGAHFYSDKGQDAVLILGVLGWGISFLVFAYSLMQLLAALEWIFRLYQVYEKYHTIILPREVLEAEKREASDKERISLVKVVNSKNENSKSDSSPRSLVSKFLLWLKK